MLIVTTEQQSNANGNILDVSCSSMNSNSIKTQACLDNCTKAQFRQQELDKKPMYECFKNFKNDQTTGT